MLRNRVISFIAIEFPVTVSVTQNAPASKQFCVGTTRVSKWQEVLSEVVQNDFDLRSSQGFPLWFVGSSLFKMSSIIKLFGAGFLSLLSSRRGFGRWKADVLGQFDKYIMGLAMFESVLLGRNMCGETVRCQSCKEMIRAWNTSALWRFLTSRRVFLTRRSKLE